jgi:hypothetical protein
MGDTPDLRAAMNGSEDAHIAVRYGKWAPEQTIVMMSRAYPSDHFRVVGILKSMTVKVTDGALSYSYHNPRSCFKLDQVDMLKATDAIVYTKLDDMAVFTVDVAGYGEDDTPRRLTGDTGMEEGDRPLGKYLEVEVSENLLDGDGDLITGVTVWLYYTEADLDRTGDGDADDPIDLDEETLAMYRWDQWDGMWVRLSEDLEWVESVSVDTEDVEMYGMAYAGSVRADLTRLSLFTAGGQILSDVVVTADPGGDMTATVGQAATFDGSASEGIGRIVRYTWTFTHDWRTVTLTGEGPQFTFTAPGEYPVTLTVRDQYGGVGVATFTVTVHPAQVHVVVGPVVDGGTMTVYNTSTPIYGATVTLTWGTEVLRTTTDFSGFARFSLPADSAGDEVRVTITAAGFEPQTYTTAFDEDGVMDRQPAEMVASEPTTPPARETEGPAGWEWGIVVLAMVLAMLALLLFVGMRPDLPRRGDGKGREEEGT